MDVTNAMEFALANENSKVIELIENSINAHVGMLDLENIFKKAEALSGISPMHQTKIINNRIKMFKSSQ
jgi:hypothetical protein